MSLSRVAHLGRRVAAACAVALAAACGDDDDNGGTTPPTPLAAPTNVVAAEQTTAGTVRVTWSAVSGAESYVIERSTGTSGTFSQVATAQTGTTQYDDTGIAPGTQVTYRVAARRGAETSTFGTAAAITTRAAAGPRVRVVSGNITANETWSADTTYVLRGFVKVVAPARLTIAAGTRIVGDSSVAGSALFILQGAQIDARGTAQQPIVFTSQRAAGSRQPGDWGGLIIVGRGQINRSGRVVLEGTTGSPTDSVVYSGGTSNSDNSGALQYVRVEFAGYPVLPNAELNAFTFAAVGSGTTLDHLQAMAGLDDSFEWFGGAVDAKYLVSYEAGDDHFDGSEGYRGRNQFLIAYQDTILPARAGLPGGPSNDPQGFEMDGCDGTGCDLGRASVPYTVPVFANFTVVGTGSSALSGQSGGVGMVLRRGVGGVYLNGIVARWPGRGVSIRDAFTDTLRMRDSLDLRNILFANNTTHFEPAGTNFGQATNWANRGIDSVSTAAHELFAALPARNPTGATQLDWTPSASSPARTGGLTSFPALIAARVGSFITPTAYRGAADPNGPKWWEGWTVYTRR